MKADKNFDFYRILFSLCRLKDFAFDQDLFQNHFFEDSFE
jgi:hypothetical protein